MWLLIASVAFASPSLVFVGNSYTQYNALPNQVQAHSQALKGWEDTEVTSLTGGGMNFADHANRMNNVGSSWADTFNAPHDWFVFQDQSQIPGFPESEVYWQNSLSGLQSMHAQVSTVGGQSILMLTWGRRDGDPQNTILYEDFTAMQERLNEGYLSYAEQAGSMDNPIYVAPVGPTFAHIHDSDSDLFAQLYDNDGSHPSQIGSVLASMAMVSSLTGRSPQTVSSSLDADTQTILVEAVDSVVLNAAVGTYPLPWVWTVLPEDGQIVDEMFRPLLRIRADQTQDLTVVDGRLWIENGRMLGNVTVEEGSELRIDGGAQVGTVDGSLILVSGRLRLTEVTGDVLQTGGEVWLDQEETFIGGTATLTMLQLPVDLEQATLQAGALDTSNLEVGEGLEWTLNADNVLELSRQAEEDTAEPSAESSTEDTGQDKETTGCGSVGILWLYPLWLMRRKRE